MLVVLYFIGILLGLLWDKSRLVRFYQLSVVWTLYVFNTANADMGSYKMIYYGHYGKHEVGFEFWRGLFAQNNIAFEMFWLVSMSIVVIAIFLASKKLFCEIHNGAISFMMLVPLLGMVISLRNSMASAVIFAAITWFFRCDSRRISNKFKFIICVFLAASFHYTALFFLIVLMVKEELPSKKSLKRAFAAMIIATIGLNSSFFGYILNSLFHGNNKVLAWFDSSNRIRGGLIMVVGLHFMGFFIAMYSNKCLRLKLRESGEVNSSIEKKIFSLNVYSMFLCGFYTFNMIFFDRLYAVVLMINTINCFHLLSKFKKNKYVVYGTLMQGVYVIIIFLALYGPRKFAPIKELFEYNALFS